MVTLTRYADVRAVLADPRYVVPTVPDGTAGIAWLRAHVARFSTGAVHERRRALAVAELARISPAVLRRRASQPDAVPVDVLAEQLGVDAPIAAEVALVARGYHPGTDAGPAADDAVTLLTQAFGGTPDELTAARIGLLVQAYAATGGLIASALPHAGDRAGVDAVLAETLRHDPPVRVTRRVDASSGTAVVLDLAAANRDPEVFTNPDRFDPARPDADRHLTFGAGLRPCPGRAHALALAAGVLDAAG